MVGRCIDAGRGLSWCAGIVPCHHLLSVWVPHIVRGVESSRRRWNGCGMVLYEDGMVWGGSGLGWDGLRWV